MTRKTITLRQRQLVELVGQCKTNKIIAFELGITEGTVKECLYNIFRRLRVSNRMELARLLWKSDPRLSPYKVPTRKNPTTRKVRAIVSKSKKETMQPPFGWRVDPNGNQRLMAYEPEARIVRAMFQLANQGASPDYIAELFNAAGIPFPGERLDEDYPQRFFRYMRWKNPEMEPLITPSLFQQVQEKLDRDPL